jgi:hypothetical protein
MTNQPPVPVSGLAAVLAIVQAVVAVVPRWLVVAAGVVFVAWLGFDLYLNAQMKLLDLEAKRGETAASSAKFIAPPDIEKMQREVLPTDIFGVPLKSTDKWTKERCERFKARGWDDLSGCEQYGITK